MNCRHCGQPLQHTFIDLGFAPPSNAYLAREDLSRPEKYFPLRIKVCKKCWLVQTEDYAQAAELFGADYAYFSSTSSGWVAHAQAYCGHVTQKLGLSASSQVVEVASNDGYLLKNFLRAGIPCLGIEPTASTAAAAEALGIPVIREFFRLDLAQRLVAECRSADLIIGNNVYAHVPDINDFTRGLATLLKPEGVVTLEFPHLMQLIQHAQFDTIYHEHYSYLSLGTVQTIFAAAGLRVWDVELLSTHGGSLRVYGCLAGSVRNQTGRVSEVLEQEKLAGLDNIKTYMYFHERVARIKDDLVTFLIEKKRKGERVVAYGAAAKGNTLLNYAGIKSDLIPYVCDAANAKQGKFLPGNHIPILNPITMRTDIPNFILILPWNIAGEVSTQLEDLTNRGVRLVVAIPELRIL